MVWMARWTTLVVLASVALAGLLGCDTVLNLGQFSFDGAACTGPSFDPSRLTPFLLPDGGLPPLPEAGPVDAGGG